MNPFPKLLEEGLINTKHVEGAVILVAKTGDLTAASNFTVCPEQTQMLIDSFKHLDVTRQRGLHFRNKLYTCVRADKHSIYTKCEGHGLILVRTALYVIVATYSQSMYPSICVEAVEKLAGYLSEKGK
ncbi:profilin-4 [Rhinichthys klamathensis goyatoka]|uniref:profilin-4 n=1 Tax=Rhinichthys klamathensis goyatoka TaxID=3034132 RepID=UPI0024B62EE9|nr:profilin-4 [Rhinichthys klamathensis goyatoka]